MFYQGRLFIERKVQKFRFYKTKQKHNKQFSKEREMISHFSFCLFFSLRKRRTAREKNISRCKNTKVLVFQPRPEFVLIFFMKKTTTPAKCKLCFALKRCNNETHLTT